MAEARAQYTRDPPPARSTLRIAMVLPSMRRAGAESVTATLCRSLATLKAEVHLVVVGNRCDYQASLAETNVHLHFLNLYQRPIPFYRLDIHRHIRHQLKHFFCALKPDIVHCHLFHSLVWWGKAAHLAGAKTFYTTHGQDPWLNAKDAASLWRRHLFARATQQAHCHFLAVSPSAAHHLAQGLGLDPDRDVTLQPNPLDPIVWQPHAKKISAKPPRILMVGTLYPLKRVHIGLLALQTLQQEKTPCELWIVGDGPERLRLETMARQLRMEHRVVFLGVREDVPDLLRQASLVWLLSEREGMPMIALEAMAMGVPLIATDVPGIRDLVHHETNGLLVPLDQPEAVARSTQNVWQNDTLRHHIITGGQATAQHCDATHMARQHLAHYHQALNDPHKRQSKQG